MFVKPEHYVMFRDLFRSCRDTLLSTVNGGVFGNEFGKVRLRGKLPVFIIASPLDMHLAQFVIRNPPESIIPIVVANGLGARDVEWLKSSGAKLPVIPLRASLRGNKGTFLSHAEVIHQIIRACGGDFCIQDADCFVVDNSFWPAVCGNIDGVYGAGPFVKPSIWNDLLIPDTFFVRLNWASFVSLRRKRGIDASISGVPDSTLNEEIERKGWGTGGFPEFGKPYYDTLQRYAVAAELSGLRFRRIPGCGESVFHVGGSSYLSARSHVDFSHWEFWPANTVYFNLRFIEFLGDSFIRAKFSEFLSRYVSSDRFLESVSGYNGSWRHCESERILASLR